MSTERDREVTSQRERTTDRSFDELATGLASGAISRRRVLRLMGSAIVGTVMASVSGVAWAAPLEGQGRPCPRGEKKCGDTCCSSPEDRCCHRDRHRVCTNVVFDRNNCGRCGNVCAAGQDCCGERCVTLNTEQNCGCCGCGCLETEQCVFDQTLQRYVCSAA